MMTSGEALEHLRSLSARLPGASETTTFGDPTFRAGKNSFAFLKQNRDDPVIWFKVSTEFQRALCEDPARYFPAPYIGRHGWTSARLQSDLSWDEIEELVIESYRAAASKKMLKELDGKL